VRVRLWVLGALVLCSACAARSALTLPTDPGTPFPDFGQIHSQLITACAGVRTMTAELGLSGRAGDQRLRGRIVAGFARPSSMRLEGVGPLGRRVFTLAASNESATLLFEGDSRVLRNERPEAILAALTGVNLAPADLQAILTGCVVPAPKPTAGRIHGNGWASIDLDGGSVVYLRRQGDQWLPAAARRDGWQIEYPQWQGRFPQTVRLQSQSAAVAVDLTTAISQLETNMDLDAAAFTVTVPAGAMPLTLEELRQAGPLRGN
jgi:outer membrane lipoprotein-sorting protein